MLVLFSSVPISVLLVIAPAAPVASAPDAPEAPDASASFFGAMYAHSCAKVKFQDSSVT